MNEMSQIAGEKIKLIDLKEGYTLEEVNTFFTKLKVEGRVIHLRLTSVNDILFPLAYGPLYILVLAFFLKNIFGVNSKWLYLALFPIALVVVDFMENINNIELLKAFPDLTTDIVEKGLV